MTFDNYVNNISKRKDLSLIIKDALSNNSNYQKQKEIVDREKATLKKLENDIKSYSLVSEINELDQLKAEVANDKLVLTDQALALFSKGQPIEVEDKNGVKYTAEFSIKFKKV